MVLTIFLVMFQDASSARRKENAATLQIWEALRDIKLTNTFFQDQGASQIAKKTPKLSKNT